MQKYLFLPAIIFMIPILIGSLIQFFNYGLSLVWLGVSVGMVSLYVNVQNEVNYIDGLSGLFSRQYLNSYLDFQWKQQERNGHSGQILAGIMLDIDRFKTVNDQFGHQTGDLAIKDVGTILRSSVGENGLAFRYAGDEFIIIQFISEEDEIKQTIHDIHTRAEQFNKRKERPYSLAFSAGYSLLRAEDSIDDFLAKMDQQMYIQKKAKKITYERSI